MINDGFIDELDMLRNDRNRIIAYMDELPSIQMEQI